MAGFKGWAWAVLCGAGALAGCAAPSDGTVSQGVNHAAFTTFDVNEQGCHPGSSNGINCNHYECADKVFVNGGPNHGGPSQLKPGSYYFAVFAPGSQNGGALDTSRLLSSDETQDRTFTIESDGSLSYTGPHDMGTSPNDQDIIRVAPFAETPNPGGVYILAICPSGSADPRDCKFDAFKAEQCVPEQDSGVPEDGGKKHHKDDP